jgi:TRAP-type C4-dicarboxylate transport system permease small subunit
MTARQAVQAMPNAAGQSPPNSLALDGPRPGSEQSSMLSMPRLRRIPGGFAVLIWAEYVSFVLAWFTAVVALVMAIGIILCILVQIFFRYMLNAPLAWTDETAVFLFAWSMLLLATIGVRERIHVRFGVLANAMPARISMILDRSVMAMIALFGAALIYISGDMLELVWGNFSPAVHYPLQALYIAVPVQGFLILVHALTNVFIGPEANVARSDHD